MTKRRAFRIVVASDGSAEARSAVTAAVAFPWPAPSQATGVMARWPVVGRAGWSSSIRVAIEEAWRRAADGTRRALRRRWPDAEVVVLEEPPVEAILEAARGAQAIVLGSRGLGLAGRLLLGSVSRGVARRAACPTLVMKGRQRGFARFVVGIDGSPNARHAAALVATLPPPRGAHVTLVAVVEPIRPGSMRLMPERVRATLAREAEGMNAERVRAAQRELAVAARPLRRTGWRVATTTRTGVPLTELLAAGAAARANAIVVGARGVGGVERLLLGSIAEGLVTKAAIPVLLVR